MSDDLSDASSVSASPSRTASPGEPVSKSVDAAELDESTFASTTPPPLRSSIDVLTAVIAGDQSLTDVLDLIAELAVRTVDGVDEASVTVFRDATARTAGFAGPNAAALDERQYATGSGPCLRAARTGTTVLVASTKAGEAGDFEDFAYYARRVGVTSATCLPLAVPGRIVGALNTFSYREPTLVTRHLPAAEAFAAAAAVVVASSANVAAAKEAAASLARAMESRAVIEQAKGVLIARLGLNAEAAFQELRRISQRDNVKLRDVASELVASAERGGPAQEG